MCSVQLMRLRRRTGQADCRLSPRALLLADAALVMLAGAARQMRAFWAGLGNGRCKNSDQHHCDQFLHAVFSNSKRHCAR